jgi:hypothetical protein
LNALTIQRNLSLNICLGFQLYCKDKKIVISKVLNQPNKVHRQTIYDVISGKKQYLQPIAMCYLAEVLNLESPTILEQHYINHLNKCK